MFAEGAQAHPAPFTPKVGAPAVVIHTVLFEDRVPSSRCRRLWSPHIQLALHGGVEAEDGGAVVQPISSASVTSNPALNRSTAAFSSRSNLAGKVMLNSYPIRIAAIGQQLLTMAAALRATLHIGIHIKLQAVLMEVSP